MSRVSEHQAIATLKGMFPDTDEAVIHEVLQLTRGNVDLAVEQLLQLQDGEDAGPMRQGDGEEEFGVSGTGAVGGRPRAPPPVALPADFLSLGEDTDGGAGNGFGGYPANAQAQADEELARRMQQQEAMRAMQEARYDVHLGSGHRRHHGGGRHASGRRHTVPTPQGAAPAHRPPPSYEPQKQKKPEEGKKDNIFKRMGRGIKNFFSRKKKADPHAQVEYSALPQNTEEFPSPGSPPSGGQFSSGVGGSGAGEHFPSPSAPPEPASGGAGAGGFDEFRDSPQGVRRLSPRRRDQFSDYSDK